MKKSESIDLLAAALAKAQSEMARAEKGETNGFFKSKYANLSSIMEASFPALNANGLAVSQLITQGDTGRFTVVTILMHSSGQYIQSQADVLHEADKGKNPNHALASAITYMRRYMLGSIVGVMLDEDDDGNSSHPQKSNQRPYQPPKVIPICPDQLKDIESYKEKIGDQEYEKFIHNMKQYYMIPNIFDLPESAYKKVKESLDLKVKAMEAPDAAPF